MCMSSSSSGAYTPPPANQPVGDGSGNVRPTRKPKANVPVAAAAAQMMVKNGSPPALTSLNANRAAEVGKIG